MSKGVMFMKENRIICISREYGSGGHEIAEKLSEDLGIKFFDKELIARVAKMADVSEEYISRREETGDYAYIFGVPIGHPATTPMDECILTPEKLFIIQSIAIRQIAEQEKSCIFVGRCADVILQKIPGCHSFFTALRQCGFRGSWRRRTSLRGRRNVS